MSTPHHRSLSYEQLTHVSRLFAALAEPNRLLLLQALKNGPMTVTELVEAGSMKQANVSRHLSVLHQHGLVRRQRDRTCIRYQIADAMILSICNLVCGKVEKDLREAAAAFDTGL